MARRFILTGAPGAGKTSIIDELGRRGLAVVREAATDIIAREQARGVAEPWALTSFTRTIAREQEERLAQARGAVQFHDRSVFCTMALARYLGHDIAPELAAAARRALDSGAFERLVFFPRLMGFIVPSAARRISLEEAERFEQVHVEIYREAGFELLYLEAGSVAERSDQVLASALSSIAHRDKLPRGIHERARAVASGRRNTSPAPTFGIAMTRDRDGGESRVVSGGGEGISRVIDAEALSGLVAAIYDASVAPDIWPAVLEECRDFIGGHSATIYAKDMAGIDGGIFYSDGGIEPHYAQLYFDKYARLDPATAGHLYAELEQAISTTDILDYEEFVQSRFHREWAKPQGLVDFLSAPIEKSGGWAAMFGVFRHERQGMVDAAMRERMKLVVPHVRRAVLIGKVLENASFKAASLSDAFDGLAAGMFLLDGSGQVVHANSSGQGMLDAGRPLLARAGRIAAIDRTAMESINEALGAAQEGDDAMGERGISVSIQGADGENYVAHILPLTAGERRRTGMRYSATAAMFVHKAVLDIPAPPAVMARTFGLTLTELRVMLAIVQVGGVPETAEALGIAETTVKTHLHRVFAKTGTSRQADLVRLVAGFASPLSR